MTEQITAEPHSKLDVHRALAHSRDRMMPQDLHFFEPTTNPKWVIPDRDWFGSLAGIEALTISEKVHLARLAIQLQWACDVLDTPDNRTAIETLGLFIVAVERGYLIVSGNAVLTEYFSFRHGQLSSVETGVLYGYPSSAILALTGVVAASSPQPLPATAAEYFLGGAYSRDTLSQERNYFAGHWDEMRSHAPEVCYAAESAFAGLANTQYDLQTIAPGE